MPSPFPGMDPYLEEPSFWVDVHLSLICEFQARLNVELRPNYYARIDERVYFTLREEIHDAFLKVVDRESGDVATIIEILKPRNKIPNSPGRDSVERSWTHRFTGWRLTCCVENAWCSSFRRSANASTLSGYWKKDSNLAT